MSLLLTGPFRFKGFNFEEAGLAFELPKQLAVSDIAVRILHTRYDHLSLLARMAHLRIHIPSHRYISDSTLITANTANASITMNTLTLIIMLMIIVNMFSPLCVLVFPHVFGPRSLAGDEEVPASIDVPQQGELKGEGKVKEGNEVQSIQRTEGRKVR